MGIANPGAVAAGMAMFVTVLIAAWWYSSSKSSVNSLNDIDVILGKEICKQKPNNCSSDAKCTSKFEKYLCTCKAGFSGDGHVCNDKDECKRKPSVCDSNAECKNTAGSFTCKCSDGYTGDGFQCNDIDECRNPSACNPNAICKNTEGKFTCSCNDGFTGDVSKCTDIDECDKGSPCDSNAECENTVGSFTCTCKSGFVGNGMTCNAKPASPTIQVVKETKTRDDAKTNCESLGGSLATITTWEEAKNVFDNTEKGKTYYSGYKIDKNGKITNEDGTPAQMSAGIGSPLPGTINSALHGQCVAFFISANEILRQPIQCTRMSPSICAS